MLQEPPLPHSASGIEPPGFNDPANPFAQGRQEENVSDPFTGLEPGTSNLGSGSGSRATTSLMKTKRPRLVKVPPPTDRQTRSASAPAAPPLAPVPSLKAIQVGPVKKSKPATKRTRSPSLAKAASPAKQPKRARFAPPKSLATYAPEEQPAGSAADSSPERYSDWSGFSGGEQSSSSIKEDALAASLALVRQGLATAVGRDKEVLAKSLNELLGLERDGFVESELPEQEEMRPLGPAPSQRRSGFPTTTTPSWLTNGLASSMQVMPNTG